MREAREPLAPSTRLRGRALTAAALACAAALGVACAKPAPEPEAVIVPEGNPLGFEEWRKDLLHCAEGRCEYVYDVTVAEPGRVRVEVYAPIDPGGPEFEVALIDADGEPIARPRDKAARPRRLEHLVAPGLYRLRIASRGDDQGPLRYEVIAHWTADRAAPQQRTPKPSGAARPSTASSAAATKSSTPTSAASAPAAGGAAAAASATAASAKPAAPAAVLMTAEVLGVERDAGAAYVLLDVGAPSGVRRDMRGALREGDTEIARFVVVEVYEDGCRARVDGELTSDLGIDTVAEIHR